MDANGDVCLGLGLGLGLTEFSPKKDTPKTNNKRVFFLDLSIPNDHHGTRGDLSSSLKIIEKQASMNSFSNGRKDDEDINFSMNFSRKKLRLTRDQTTLLEDSFRQHTTLNMVQKQSLAEKLNLNPRQVEVWFQNRRARTKLKQTEVECEFLKKNCERLSDENRKLKKELLELRSSMTIEEQEAPRRATTPFCHHNHKGAAATPREKNGTDRGGGEATAAAVLEVVQMNPN